MKEYHIAEYYTKKGEYGEICKSSDFLEAVEKASEFISETNNKYAYIGVKGNTDLFAIGFINKKYLEVAKGQAFANENWLASANQFIKDNNPCIGVFRYTKRAKDLIAEFHRKNPIQRETQ